MNFISSSRRARTRRLNAKWAIIQGSGERKWNSFLGQPSVRDLPRNPTRSTTNFAIQIMIWDLGFTRRLGISTRSNLLQNVPRMNNIWSGCCWHECGSWQWGRSQQIVSGIAAIASDNKRQCSYLNRIRVCCLAAGVVVKWDLEEKDPNSGRDC